MAAKKRTPTGPGEAKAARQPVTARKPPEVSAITGTDAPSLLLEIVDAAIAVTGADKGNIQLLEGSSGMLTIVASRGFERPFLEFFKEVHEGHAACGTALQTGNRVVIDDVSASPVFAGTPALDVLLSAGVRAVQTTPLVGRSGRLVGMLSTHYRTPPRLADRDLHVLDLLARQAADRIERMSAEKATHESEERFRKIFENAATAIAISDWQGRFQQCNPAYCALLGYSEQELHEINFASLVHPEDLEANLVDLRRLQAGEVPSFEIENRYVHRDGQPIWVHKFISVLPDKTGKPAYHLALVTDITERKQAAAALRESEEKLRLFIEHAPVALAMFDRQMRYLAVSRRWLADYRLGDKKIIGRSHYEVFPEIPHRWREAYWRGMEGEVARAEEDFFSRADGKKQCLRWEVRPWKQADGTIGGIVILTEDLSARKQAEEALVQSEERFRLMADHAPVMIWMSGTDKLGTWFNKPWLAFVGRSMGQELGNGWTENVHAGDFDRCLKTYAAAFDARQPFTMEYRLQRHDGEYRWVLDNGIPVHSVSGEFTGYIGSCVDITERKQAEEALRNSEAESRRLLDYQRAVMANMGEGLYTTDTQGLVTYMNPAAESLFGWKSAEVLGRMMHDVTHYLHPDGRPFPIEECVGFQALNEGKVLKDHDDVLVRRDGTCFPVVLSSSPLVYEGKVAGRVVAFRDVTGRKRGEEKLRQVTADLRAKVEELTTLLDILPAGVLIADPQCRRITGNRAFNEMIGLPQGGNASLTSEQSDMPAGIRVYRDGRELTVEELPMQVTGLSGRRFRDFDHDLVFPDGRVLTLLANTAPLVDEHGAIRGVVGAYMDISARKRAEEKLRKSEGRMQAILNTAGDAIITMDIHGMIHSVNPVGERMFGYAAAEMIGHNVGLLMPSPYREEHDGYLKRYLQTGEKHIIGAGRELEARRKDGGTFPIHLVVSEIEDRKLFTGILRDMTAHKQLERDVVEAASLQQRHIGQDLHDTVAQELTALNLLARDLAETLRTDPEKAPHLVERIDRGLQRSQRELRAVLRGLLPVPVEGEGLMAALADLADRTRQEGKVVCAFDCPEPVSLADNLAGTHLYLIAQEAVHNALKHARPRNVRISLRLNRALVLRVECDGMGMPAGPAASKGLGLRIMRNRAAIIGATLTIGPAKPTGTVVTCALTRKNDERQPNKGARSGPDRR
jgi:PAS domain S-box-containing protein